MRIRHAAAVILVSSWFFLSHMSRCLPFLLCLLLPSFPFFFLVSFWSGLPFWFSPVLDVLSPTELSTSKHWWAPIWSQDTVTPVGLRFQPTNNQPEWCLRSPSEQVERKQPAREVDRGESGGFTQEQVLVVQWLPPFQKNDYVYPVLSVWLIYVESTIMFKKWSGWQRFRQRSNTAMVSGGRLIPATIHWYVSEIGSTISLPTVLLPPQLSSSSLLLEVAEVVLSVVLRNRSGNQSTKRDPSVMRVSLSLFV